MVLRHLSAPSGNYITAVASTDKAIARFNGTLGQIQNSTITIDDNFGTVSGLGALNGSVGGVLQIAGDVLVIPDVGLYFKIQDPTSGQQLSLSTSLLIGHRTQSFPDQDGTFLLERISDVNSSVSLYDVDSNKVFSNVGASGDIVYNLPEAAPGYSFTFIITEANRITIVLPSGTSLMNFSNIRGTNISGSIYSNQVGSEVTIYSQTAFVYTARSIEGAWVIDI